MTQASPTLAPSLTTPEEPRTDGEVIALPKVRRRELDVAVRRLIRDELAKTDQADPTELVESVLQKLVKTKQYGLLIAAARFGLRDIAWGEITNDPGTRRADRRPGSARWERARKAEGEYPDIFAARVFTGAETKFLGDCTKADLLTAAGYKRKQARTMGENAGMLEKLSRKLSKDQVVSALDRAVVEGVFHA